MQSLKWHPSIMFNMDTIHWSNLTALTNVEHLSPVLLKGHLCEPDIDREVTSSLYAGRKHGFEFGEGMWPSPSIHQGRLWSVSVLAETRCCAALSTSPDMSRERDYCKTPQTKSSLHLALLCSCSSEVLIQECSGCFSKVCGGGSSSSGVKHK